MFFSKSRPGKNNAHNSAGFTGLWHSTFGPLSMEREGDTVSGTYRFGAIEGGLEGRVKGRRLTFRYREPGVSGEGWFDLLGPCRFAGRWRPEGSDRWFDWIGESGFDGIWNSTFGLLKLSQDDDGSIKGFYEIGGPSSIEGGVSGSSMEFSYREPNASGKGSFTLGDDAMSFTGSWRQDGTILSQPWEGRRILPVPGISWLVVLEAHWQRYLNEREYSFGAMLDEFFARLPHVNVSHRFFTDAEGLLQWCRSLMYLPEPVHLVIASHATEEGLTVLGKVIDHGVLAEGLRHADTVRLAHFSSCLLMNHGGSGGTAERLHSLNRFPVSGYTTSVNWAASAIIEFTYLDLILEQGLTPEEASKELLRLMPFSGESAPAGNPYGAAGFRILLPEV